MKKLILVSVLIVLMIAIGTFLKMKQHQDQNVSGTNTGGSEIATSSEIIPSGTTSVTPEVLVGTDVSIKDETVTPIVPVPVSTEDTKYYTNYTDSDRALFAQLNGYLSILKKDSPAELKTSAGLTVHLVSLNEVNERCNDTYLEPGAEVVDGCYRNTGDKIYLPIEYFSPDDYPGFERVTDVTNDFLILHEMGHFFLENQDLEPAFRNDDNGKERAADAFAYWVLQYKVTKDEYDLFQRGIDGRHL